MVVVVGSVVVVVVSSVVDVVVSSPGPVGSPSVSASSSVVGRVLDGTVIAGKGWRQYCGVVAVVDGAHRPKKSRSLLASVTSIGRVGSLPIRSSCYSYPVLGCLFYFRCEFGEGHVELAAVLGCAGPGQVF